MNSVQRVSRRHPVFLIVISLVVMIGGTMSAEERVARGALRFTDPETSEVAEFPLQHTSVHVAVSGTVAEVTVTQRFANPLDRRLEAVYVFPLPNRAAVDQMSIRVGERLIRGEIHRRQEAREIYEDARAAGHLTGLLDQERPNIFTQRLANILPGEAVEVVIHYVEDIHYDHGS
ncbi:MAG: VIT domain-containing protein [Thermoanaerobaculales bacterium]